MKALITGSRSGLGKALALLLETKGYTILYHSSKEAELTTAFGVDTLKRLIDREKPDLLVNNAGIGLYGHTRFQTPEEQDKILSLNINALTTLSTHFANTLIAANRPGTILNISSAAAFFPFPSFNLYAASKAYVNHFSLALNAELSPHHITVLCACPGQIATHFRAQAAKGHPQKPDRRTMTAETAATHLYKQLQSRKFFTIFDWRTKWLVLFAKFLPRKLLSRLLDRSIQDRISH